MDEQKQGLSLLTLALIGIVLVMGVFLIIESIFIVAAAGLLPDFSSPLATSKVAVIYIEGEMMTDGGARPRLFGLQDVVHQLRVAEADPGVKAIVLRINSPGEARWRRRIYIASC
jgi:protease IV